MNLLPLYKATAQGELSQALDAQPDLVQAETAEQARTDFQEANEAGRPDIAYLAAMTAAFIHLRLGLREPALTDRFNAAQALFMIAEEPPAYDEARAEALQVGALALEFGTAGLPFRCWVLAADCAWFACEAAGSDKVRLIQAIRDCADALLWAGRLTDAPEQDGWLERLASLTGAVAAQAMATVWPDEQLLETNTLLRRLARDSENLPVELAFESTGGADKAAQVSAMLADLESRYGAP